MKAHAARVLVATTFILSGCGLLGSEEEAEFFGVMLGAGFAEQQVRVEVDGVEVFDGMTWNEEMIAMLGFAASMEAEPRWGTRAVEVTLVTGDSYSVEVEAKATTTVIAERTLSGVRFDVAYVEAYPH